jgi:hypothetical protein
MTLKLLVYEMRRSEYINALIHSDVFILVMIIIKITNRLILVVGSLSYKVQLVINSVSV